MTKPLAPREEQIVELIVLGKTSREIGVDLGISTQVVKNYIGRIGDKLGVRGRVEIAVWASKRGGSTDDRDMLLAMRDEIAELRSDVRSRDEQIRTLTIQREQWRKRATR